MPYALSAGASPASTITGAKALSGDKFLKVKTGDSVLLRAASLSLNTDSLNNYIGKGILKDTATNLRALIATKLNSSDTLAMLNPYLRKIDTASLSNRINTKLNSSDTLAMLNPYLRKLDTASLSSRINTKLNTSDTLVMLANYLNWLNNLQTTKLNATDTASLSSRINTKLNSSDTSVMLNPYLRKIDTASLSNRINAQWSTKGNAATTAADFIGTTDAQPITIKTNNTNALTITADQKLGIGTASPNTKLEINSNKTDTAGLRFTKLTAASKYTDSTTQKLLSVDSAGNVILAKLSADSSQLQKITEASNTGWRILGRNPANYGNIGSNAIDLSYSDAASTTGGATGFYSIALGLNTTASGNYTTAMGTGTTASGHLSTAMGNSTTASGTNATAMGNSTTASGTNATAMGNGTTAWHYSTAMGNSTTASGNTSTAMGNSTTASGDASTAIGYGTTAKSFGETVVGSYNTDYVAQSATTFNTADRAFVVGIGSAWNAAKDGLIVWKNGSVGIGTSNNPNTKLEINSGYPDSAGLRFTTLTAASKYTDSTTQKLLSVDSAGNVILAKLSADSSQLQKTTQAGNTGWRILGRNPANYGDIGDKAIDLSFSDGETTTTGGATGSQSFATGQNTTASGVYATAMGYGTDASGNYGPTAMGFNTTASGDVSTAMGYFTKALGSGATAMGANTTASGNSATALGNNTKAPGDAATAMGYQTIASGSYSTAIGTYTTAKSYGELSLGVYNDTLLAVNATAFAADSNRLFTVGNGTAANALKTAFVVQQDGNVGINTRRPNTKLEINSGKTDTAGLRFTTLTAASKYTDSTTQKLLSVDSAGNVILAKLKLGDSSQLQKITENSKTGWRILGRNTANYGDIGVGAIDLSYNDNAGNDTAGARGNRAVAMGYNTTASGDNAMAMGLNTAASGNNSTAMGNFTTALGDAATAMGDNTTALGNYSTAMGNTTTASGNNSTAMGIATTASGNRSTAMGYVTTASGNSSTAMGVATEASNYAATAMGVSTIASGEYAIAMGDFTTASGNSALAVGTSTIASGNASAAMGLSTAAQGFGSTAMGAGTMTKSFAELAIGSYNDTLSAVNAMDIALDSNRLFTVGNGTDTNARHTAFVIQQDGKVGINTRRPDTTLHLVGGFKYIDGNQSIGRVLTSDANGVASWQPITLSGGNISQLEKITEGVHTGWRILGRDSLKYGNIGSNAIDFSYSDAASTTMGATGDYATAMGWNTIAKGPYSTTMGYRTNASGYAAVAMGLLNTASGDYSTTMGYQTTASQQLAIATGYQTTASGERSTAMGYGSTASGNTSTAMGSNTTASGDASTAMGYATKASGNTSTAMGYATKASGGISTAMGRGTAAKSYGELSIGAYNDTLQMANQIAYSATADSSRLFTVGSGTGGATRKTAFVIQQDGKVGINTRRPTAMLEIAGNVKIVDGTEGANKVLTSDANGVASWQPITVSGGNISQLEKITEGAHTGYRIFDRLTANYGNIGVDAIDLSYSNAASTTMGATVQNAVAMGTYTTASGQTSTAMGENTIASAQDATAMGISTIASGIGATAMGGSSIASGMLSTAMGRGTISSGDNATAMGRGTVAKNYGELSIGNYNDTLVMASQAAYSATADSSRLFTVGSGTGEATRKTAFIIQQDGKVGINTRRPAAMLDIAGNVKIVDGTEGANKVLTSDANGVASWQPITLNGGNISQLEKITENNQTGWRILGRDSLKYGNIGSNAIDLSYSDGAAGTLVGATGSQSFATGWNITASGTNSTAMGTGTTASQDYSTAMGAHTTATGRGSTAMGAYTTASGNYASTAMGYYTTASGEAAMAMGNYTTASGEAAMAMGNNAKASGIASTAMGGSTIASGGVSTAMGGSTIASGYASTAMGYETIASGDYATAMGRGTAAKNYGELSIGNYNDTLVMASQVAYSATADSSRLFTVGSGTGGATRKTAFVIQQDGKVGINTRRPTATLDIAGSVKIVDGTEGANKVLMSDANGVASWKAVSTNQLEKIIETVGDTGYRILGRNPANYGNIGSQAIDLSYSGTASATGGATGDYAMAMGLSTTASNDAATAMGEGATASGYASTAMGLSTTASGYAATAMGEGTTASGYAATAMGYGSTASGYYSAAMGYYTTASGNYSTAMGRNTTAKSFGETVVGSHNTSYTPTNTNSFSSMDRAFVVGIGSASNATKDGLIVWKNGKVDIGGNAAIGGNVGIGTSSATKAALQVDGWQSNTSISYNYFNYDNLGGGGNPPGVYSIWANKGVAASEFTAFSDARIKEIKNLSNNQEDLKILSQLRITDYTMKDKIVYGNKAFKKLIAQEVEAVYPLAVSKSTNIIPNIYQAATIKNGFIALKTDLVKGDKVKIYTGEAGNTAQEVVVKAVSPTGFAVEGIADGKLFVYGKEVNDFRSIDYEALGTLNISATQALLKKIEVLETHLNAKTAGSQGLIEKIAVLEKENAGLKTTIETLAADMKTLKTLLMKDPVATK